jgi:hypothetical protein
MSRYDALENEVFNYSAGWIWSLYNIGKVTQGWVCVGCTFILFGPYTISYSALWIVLLIGRKEALPSFRNSYS